MFINLSVDASIGATEQRALKKYMIKSSSKNGKMCILTQKIGGFWKKFT
jgi:hypothetical protein